MLEEKRCASSLSIRRPEPCAVRISNVLGAAPHTNGLLRQYFPKGTNLSHFSQAHLNRVALRLNQRPRKTLGFETPADRLQAVLR